MNKEEEEEEEEEEDEKCKQPCIYILIDSMFFLWDKTFTNWLEKTFLWKKAFANRHRNVNL